MIEISGNFSKSEAMIKHSECSKPSEPHQQERGGVGLQCALESARPGGEDVLSYGGSSFFGKCVEVKIIMLGTLCT